MKSYKRMTVSEKAITRELYEAIQAGGLDRIVDVIEEGNMYAVTSNAVAKALAQYITQTGTILISVRNFITGELLEGIQVKVGNITKTTDSTGICSFENFKYGSYMVKIFADGYDPFFDSIYLNTNFFEFTAELTPEQARYGTVNLSIIDKNTLEGVNEASVKVNNEIQITNDQGKCSFTQVPYGSYITQVQHAYYNDAFDSFTLDEAVFDEVIEITPKSESKYGNINITIYDKETSLPLPMVKVSIGSQTLITDDTGACSFKNLLYGSYLLTASIEGYKIYESTILLEAQELDYNIELNRQKGTINLTVVDEITSSPLKNAQVTINDTTQTTDADGKCSFTNLNYDSYVVDIVCKDYNSYKTIITLYSDVVDYTAKLSQTVATGNVTIYVRDKNTQKYVDNVSVTLNTETKETDSDGKCVFTDLVYSTYTLKAVHENYNNYMGSVTVDSPEVVYMVDLVPTTQKGDLYVTVLNSETSNPVSSATVTVGGIVQETNSSGECVFLDLEYMDYSIKINHDNYKDYESIVTLASKEFYFTAKLTPVSEMGTVNVTVVDETTSDPIESVTVNFGDKTQTTDNKGKCSFNDIEYGDYLIEINQDGYYKYADNVTVNQKITEYNAKLIKGTGKGDLYITVLDKTTQSPIKGAAVTVGDYTVETSDAGTCSIVELSYGDYPVTITHDGYVNYKDIVTINSSKINYNVELTPVQKGTVNVTVVDEVTSTPIESATVTINNISKNTDSKGECSFSDLEYKDYDITISHDGYEKYENSVTVDAPEINYNVKLTPKQVTVNVTVVDETTSTPIKSATVKLDDNTQITDSTGKCTFNNIVYGDYSLEISKDGYYNYTDTLTVNKEVTDYVAKLSQIIETGTINVTVLDNTLSTPITEATVQIDNITQTTDTDGKCTFTNIAYGDHNVTIEHDNYNKYTDTVTLTAKTLNYTANLIAINLATVIITILDGTTEAAVPNATVSIGSLSDVTGTSGTCTFINIPYGTYDVLTTCDGYVDYTESVIVQRDTVTKKIKIKQKSKTTFKGKVIDGQGALEGVTVNVEGQGELEDGTIISEGDIYSAVTDSDGNYTLTLPSATYSKQYAFIFEKELYKTLSITVKTGDTEYIMDTQKMELSEYPTTCTISGLAKNLKYNTSEYEPSNNAILTFQHVETANTYEYTTNTDGTFKLENINAGNYNLKISSSDNVYKEETQSNVLFIRPNQTLSNLEFILTKLNHEFKLGATYDNGALVNNCKVEIYASGSVIASGTITQGTFTFQVSNNLKTTLTARVYYTNKEYADFSIGSSANTEANIVIPVKKGNVTVTVLNNKTQEPLAGAYVSIGDSSGTTGTTGKCTLDVIYGTHDLRVSCTDYEAYTGTLTVDSAIVTSTVQLIPLTLLTFSGQVSDGQGMLESVTVQDTKGYGVTTTDSEGKYKLQIKSNLDLITLSFSKTYYKTETMDVTIEKDKTEYVVDMQLELEDYNVFGTIDNGLVQNQKYQSTDYESSSKLSFILEHVESGTKYNCLTDVNGLFNLNLYAGTYNFVIKGNSNYKTETQTNVFFIRPEQVLEDLKLIATKITHDFELKVKHTSGEAASKRKVEIYDKYATNVLAVGVTDESGNYIFKASHETEILLNAKVYLLDGTVYEQDIGYSTGINAKITIPDESSETGGSLNIFAYSEELSKFVDSAEVTINGETQVTGTDGKCTFKELDYGYYNVNIIHEKYIEYNNVVLVNSSEVDSTEYLILKSGEVTITTMDSSTKEIVENAEITIDNTITGITDSKGQYVCSLKYYIDHTIDVSCLGYKYYTNKFTVDSEKMNYDVNLTPQATHELKLKVYYDDGTVVSSRKVEVYVKDSSEIIARGLTDESGFFIFNSPTGTKVTLRAKVYLLDGTTPEQDIGYSDISSAVITIPKETAQTGTINIIVRDDTTSKIVSSANVIINGETQVTGTDGKCTFNNIQYGYYNVNIIHEKYIEYNKTILLDASEITSTHYLTLKPSNPAKVTITTINNSTQQPVENAEITINNITEITDNEGKCIFSLDYITQTFSSFCVGYVDSSGSIVVDSEEINYTIKLTPQATHTITMKVLNEDQSIASGYKLEIHDEAKTRIFASGTTDDNGNFKFTINNNPDILLYTTIYLSDGSTFVKEIGYSSITSYVKIIITPPPTYSTVTLKVVDENSKAISNANVVFGGNTCITNASGQCKFEKLEMDTKYVFKVTHSHYEDYEDEIKVTQEEQIQTVSLTKVCLITGQVVDISGQPVSGVKVQIRGITKYYALTDESGGYVLKCSYTSTPTTYMFLYSKSGYKTSYYEKEIEGYDVTLRIIEMEL